MEYVTSGGITCLSTRPLLGARLARLFLTGVLLLPLAFPITGMGAEAGDRIAVSLAVPDHNDQPVVRFAVAQLQKHLAGEGATSSFVDEPTTPARGRIEMIIDPAAVHPPSVAVPESFRLIAAADGSLKMIAADGPALLWAVRDFQHYYCTDWLEHLRDGTPVELNILSAPTIQTRGFWTWLYGCKDVFAYIDRASDWKLNHIIFWNLGVPMNADRINEYAHERGVKIWWGFSFGWTAGDFRDASPALATRLQALYESQKAKIGPTLANLCPQEPETPEALKDFVLDVYENQYAWIPDIDGIYFQTATEAICPCDRCKQVPIGESVMQTVLPIIEELHRRHPTLKISAGMHNKGEQFVALRRLPNYVNICWEAGTTWAPTVEDFKTQMTYRGAEEDFSGIYRITMNCGMDVLGQTYGGEKDRVWLNRVDQLWNYIEEGRLPESGKKWPIVVNGKDVGYPCVSDWRPPAGKRLLDNTNFQTLLEWSGELAKGPPRSKGIFPLVEAGFIDLKMRRVPAMVAETIWNPLADQTELERRCRMIWDGSVGGWPTTPNPYWTASQGDAPHHAAGTVGDPTLDDLGNVYKEALTGDTKK